jgi:hypothetical protein
MADNHVILSGGYCERVPPVPIPNTEVKPFRAEDTWRATARENRSPPDSKMNKPRSFSGLVHFAFALMNWCGSPADAHARGMDA